MAKLRLLGDDGLPVDDDAALPALDAEAQRTDHTLIVRDPRRRGSRSTRTPTPSVTPPG